MQIKYFFFIILLTCSGLSAAAQEDYLYGILVTEMPFFTFWNRSKVVDALCSYSKMDKKSVKSSIEKNETILISCSEQKAQQLKKMLNDFNCEIILIKYKHADPFEGKLDGLDNFLKEKQIDLADVDASRKGFVEYLDSIDESK